MSHKIPRHPDRHVYEDGSFCLVSPLKEYLICKKGISMSTFLTEILDPFLACQVAISAGWRTGFPQGEFGHNSEGIYQSFAEHFRVNDPNQIINAILLVLTKNNRNMDCFCNSGKKLKYCHFNEVILLNGMSKQNLTKYKTAINLYNLTNLQFQTLNEEK